MIKPIDLDTLSETVQRIIDHALLYREGDYYTRTGKGDPPSLLIGESPAIRQLRSDLRTLATSAATLLILGESGVGKGKIAEELHRLGPRASAPFIELDCCLLQETLLESELFGHERGAFTGAVQRKPGLIEQAQGGTLFLDEIGEIPATIQAKLLRLLETRRFRRLGGVEDLSADVRIIAATNRHLESMVESGEYRQDLYFRLNTLCLVAPPLRERPEDILPLADHFLRQTAHSQQSVKRLHLSTQETLLRHDWPGNVRELRNVMERAATLSGHRRRIDPEHLGLTLSQSKPAAPVLALNFDHLPTLDELEQTYLEWLMERHQGHRADIARILGIGERTLYRKLAESHTSPKAITPPEKEE